MTRFLWRLSLGLLLALSVVGCKEDDGRRPVFPVSGTVTVDGVRAEHAYLVFYPTNTSDEMAPKPTAVADKDGNLVVTTYKTGDGAPAGEYKVTIEWPKMVNQMGRLQRSGDQLKGKYATKEKSAWTVTIKEGENKLPPFEIKMKE